MTNSAKATLCLSLVRLIKRNLAEHRMQRNAQEVDVVYTRAIKDNLDNAVMQLELELSEIAAEPVQDEPVITMQLPAPEPTPQSTPEPAVEQPQPQVTNIQPIRSAANLQRDKEIREAMIKQQNSANAAKPVDAIGANRDTVTRTLNLHSPFETPPESELRENNTYLAEIPGTNTRPVSPMERLIDKEHSELLRLFAPSPFLPEASGIVAIPSEEFPWHKHIQVLEREPEKIIKLPQGAYGVNPETMGPEFIMIRLQKAALLWNLKDGMESLRIFYIGRSNVHGYWLTTQHLTMTEQMSVVASLVETRRRLIAKANGQEYVPVARLRD